MSVRARAPSPSPSARARGRQCPTSSFLLPLSSTPRPRPPSSLRPTSLALSGPGARASARRPLGSICSRGRGPGGRRGVHAAVQSTGEPDGAGRRGGAFGSHLGQSPSRLGPTGPIGYFGGWSGVQGEGSSAGRMPVIPAGSGRGAARCRKRAPASGVGTPSGPGSALPGPGLFPLSQRHQFPEFTYVKKPELKWDVTQELRGLVSAWFPVFLAEYHSNFRTNRCLRRVLRGRRLSCAI